MENLLLLRKQENKSKLTKQLNHQESPIIQISGGFSYQTDSGTK